MSPNACRVHHGARLDSSLIFFFSVGLRFFFFLISVLFFYTGTRTEKKKGTAEKGKQFIGSNGSH